MAKKFMGLLAGLAVVGGEVAEWARDPAGFQRVMHAVMPMKKLDIAALRQAYDGK